MRRTQQLASSFIVPLLSAGLLLTAEALPAQSARISCRANASGDGWVCETQEPAPVPAPTGAPVASANLSEDSIVPVDQARKTVGDGPDLAGLLTTPDADSLLDWRAREAMTPEQRAALPANCCGGFIDPLASLPGVTSDPEQAQTRFQSIGGLRQPAPGVFDLSGEVTVQQGSRFISNDQSTRIDRPSDTVAMTGNLMLREPGLLLLGQSATIDGSANQSEVEGAHYVLHDYGVHGSAARLSYSGDSGLLSIENGEFSRCEPQNEFWTLSAATITLDQQRNRGYAEDVQLRLAGQPVFYYPFTLAFPLGEERLSGFLAPSLGSTRTGGLDIELPYYLNIAPQADATVAPRLVSDRGVMLNTELRYLASWSMNTLNASFLGDDARFDPITAGQAASDSPPVSDRWFLGYQHQGALGPGLTTFIDYNAASDNDYFFDLGGTGLNMTSQSHLNRQGRIDFYSPLLRAGLNFQRIQILDPFAQNVAIYRPYDRLPELTLNSGSYLGAGFEFALAGQVTSFDRSLDESELTPQQLANGALVTGQRFNLEPSLIWAREAPGWFTRATTRYRYREYRLDRQAQETAASPDAGVPVFSLDGGLVFDRPRSGGGTQTLEPRLYYLYAGYQDQDTLPLFDTTELNFSFNQLFRDERFAGGDRFGDADQLTAAVTSRWLAPDGAEQGRVSLGQIQYFQQRFVSLSNPLQTWQPRYALDTSSSSLVGEVALRLFGDWRLDADLQWNQDRQEADEGSLRLRYQSARDRIVNLAYRYRRLVNTPNFMFPADVDPRIKQTDLSGVWPLNANWTLLGRWNYDLSNSRNLETFAGVEWSNCCATLRFVAREWVDDNELFVPNREPNRGFFVQFTLHGLGSLAGGGLSNLLSDGIQGYRDNDQSLTRQ